jgi:hypothetical protein
MTSNTSKGSGDFDINAEFRSVMHDLGLSPEDTGGSITFIGEDPIFPRTTNSRDRGGKASPDDEPLRWLVIGAALIDGGPQYFWCGSQAQPNKPATVECLEAAVVVRVDSRQAG